MGFERRGSQSIGDALRRSRLRAGITQEELAARADVHPTYVGEIERGEKDVSVRVLAALAHALDTTASELLAGVC